MVHEKKVGAGSYAIFNLGGIGFLKLFASNRPDGFPEAEMAQLKQVVDKLKVSLDGCFAHIRLREETERRMLAQKALQESENKLRRIIDSALDAVVSVDANGIALEWNVQAENMFGYTREEALGKQLADLILPEKYRNIYLNNLWEQVQLPASSNVNERYEIKCKRKDGSLFSAELSISINLSNRNLLFVGFLRDITEQRRAKLEINRAHTRLENLITNLQAGILLEDSDRKVVLANKAFCDMFGLPVGPDAMIGMDCAAAAIQSKELFMDPEAFISDLNLLIRDKRLVENHILYMKNGRVLERDYIPLFSGNKYDGHLWQYRDITERQNAEQAIRDSEEKYRGILDNMDLGLLEVDREENILRTNNAFCQMMGYTQEELLGKNAQQLVVAPQARALISQRNEERLAGISSVYKLQMQRKDGSYMWGLISGAPIKNSQGQVVGSIGIHFDLTARKTLENALAEAKLAADRARAAERHFLAHMSHEIRTPINAVIGMTHLLFDTRPTVVQQEYLQSLRFAADSLLGIIDNILDLSKIDAGEIEFEHKPFDLAYLLKSLVLSFHFKTAEKQIAMVEQYDSDVTNLVVGDPNRLNQILTNLLGNATKFTESGSITLATRILERDEARYLIEFRVSDTGIGIEQDKLETIFEYFKQADVQINRKFGGTGLGLTIVKQLVERMGGSIKVNSRPGEGTDFVFILKFGNSGKSAQAIDALKPRDFQQHDHEMIRGMRFLIVEDNLLNQMLLCKTFDAWGCQYEVARNGEEALVKTSGALFDAILMDIHMPGMDGFETTRTIRQLADNPNRNTPIIALTAAAMLEDKKRSFEVGMNGFLTKPIAPKMLLDELLRSVADHRAHQSRPVFQPDLRYLTELSQGDRSFVESMVRAFLEETPVVLDHLKKGISELDNELIYKLLHTLKPNLGMLGLKELQERTASLERVVREENSLPEPIQARLAELIDCISETLEATALHADSRV